MTEMIVIMSQGSMTSECILGTFKGILKGQRTSG